MVLRLLLTIRIGHTDQLLLFAVNRQRLQVISITSIIRLAKIRPNRKIAKSYNFISLLMHRRVERQVLIGVLFRGPMDHDWASLVWMPIQLSLMANKFILVHCFPNLRRKIIIWIRIGGQMSNQRVWPINLFMVTRKVYSVFKPWTVQKKNGLTSIKIYHPQLSELVVQTITSRAPSISEWTTPNFSWKDA